MLRRGRTDFSCSFRVGGAACRVDIRNTVNWGCLLEDGRQWEESVNCHDLFGAKIDMIKYHIVGPKRCVFARQLRVFGKEVFEKRADMNLVAGLHAVWVGLRKGTY